MGRTSLLSGAVSVLYLFLGLFEVGGSVLGSGFVAGAAAMAWMSGYSLSSRRGLAMLREAVDRSLGDSGSGDSGSALPEREALLARLNQGAAAYPELWKVTGAIVVPLVGALLGGAVAIVVAVAS